MLETTVFACQWDSASGAQLAELHGRLNAVLCVTLSSVGHFAASASEDGTICMAGSGLPVAGSPGGVRGGQAPST